MKAWIEARGRGPAQIEAGKTGQFDILLDGKVIYSRYDTGRFPTEADLLKILR